MRPAVWTLVLALGCGPKTPKPEGPTDAGSAEDAAALEAAGWLALDAGDADAAVSAFDAALAIDGDRMDARLGRGLARIAQGEPAAAKGDLCEVWREGDDPAARDRAGAALGPRTDECAVLEPGETWGELPKRAIEKVIAEALPALHRCYDEVRAGGDFAAELRVQFKIGPDGRIRERKVHRDTPIPDVFEECVGGVVDRLVFPRPSDGGVVVVTYPFLFEP